MLELTAEQIKIVEFLKENPNAICMTEDGQKLFVLEGDGGLTCYRGQNFKGFNYQELRDWIESFGE